MSSAKTLFSWKRYLSENLEFIEQPPRDVAERKAIHPFPCRLGTSAIAFDISNPTTLTEVGFNCWALGMLTIFRPCHVILTSMITRIKPLTSSVQVFQMFALPLCYTWIAIVLFVLFILGFIPILSGKIKKRWILLIQPWMLMMMYFDVVIWLSITTYLYIELQMISPAGAGTIRQVQFTSLFILILYFDIFIYFLVYYIFITFYIVAQITIIEKFY